MLCLLVAFARLKYKFMPYHFCSHIDCSRMCQNRSSAAASGTWQPKEAERNYWNLGWTLSHLRIFHEKYQKIMNEYKHPWLLILIVLHFWLITSFKKRFQKWILVHIIINKLNFCCFSRRGKHIFVLLLWIFWVSLYDLCF